MKRKTKLTEAVCEKISLIKYRLRIISDKYVTRHFPIGR